MRCARNCTTPAMRVRRRGGNDMVETVTTQQLIARVGQIRHLPAVVVQGRYDMVCPVGSADELVRAWPEAEYVIVPDAGHAANIGLTAELAIITDLACHTRDLRRERAQLIHHPVDGVFQF